MLRIVQTDNAPKAIGPYSQAVVANGLIFCSGQIGLRANGTLVEGGVTEQTAQIMNNLRAILQAVGSSLDKVIKTTIFLTDMNDFARVNETYGSYFTHNPPARATVEVSRLPKNATVEIECIAVV